MRVFVVGFGLLAACGAPAGPVAAPSQPCPSGAAAPQRATYAPARGTGLDVLLVPPPFRSETLAAEIERVLKSSDTGPVGEGIEAQRRFVTPDPRRVRMSVDQLLHLVFETEPEEGHPGRKAQVHDEVFAGPPSAVVEPDGTLELAFATLEAASAASVFFGTIPSDGALALPRYRHHLRASTEPGGHTHSARINLRRLLDPKLDVADIRATGRGLVAYRLEVLDPVSGAARVLDHSTAFRCEPVPCDEDARFIGLPTQRRGPEVNLVQPTSAVLTLSTDVPTFAAVLVQGEGEDPKRFLAKAPATRHEIELGGLSPRTRYRYAVFAADARGEVSVSPGGTFETAPRVRDVEAAVRFVVLGDSRSGYGSGEERYVGTNRRVLSELMVRALAQNPGFILFNGDLADGYTTEPGSYRHGLEAWQEIVAPVGAYVPIYELMGNHEALVEAWERGWAIGRSGAGSAEAIFAEVFTNPRNGPASDPGAPPLMETVYSFDHGPVHVSVVNSNYWWRSHPHRADHPAASQGQREGWIDARSLEWLDKDLGAARRAGAAHLVVCTHEPPFPVGGHASDGMYWDGLVPEVIERRDAFLRLISRHGVSLLFAGDEHNYSRLQIGSALVSGLAGPLTQIVSGGAGAPYYARDLGVPWADAVARFDVRQHYVRVEAEASRLWVEAIAITGEVIERHPIEAR